MKPSSIEMRNPKPFWKEPSLKHVWARANDGAKVMMGTMLFIIFTAFVARFIGEGEALWVLGCGVGFAMGWIFHDLSKPYDGDK